MCASGVGPGQRYTPLKNRAKALQMIAIARFMFVRIFADQHQIGQITPAFQSPQLFRAPMSRGGGAC